MNAELKNLHKPEGFAASVLWYCVKLYKIFLSPIVAIISGEGCRFHPTCSIYAMEALRRHGAIKGGILAVCRILRCQPFCSAGFDYVPREFKISRLFKQNKVDEWRGDDK